MEREPLNARRKLLVRGTLAGFAVALLAGVLVVVAKFPPTDNPFYPKCNFHLLTGLHCPGCGLTRCAHAMLNADPMQALAYNAVGLVFLPWLGLILVRGLWSWVWRRPPKPYRPSRSRVNWSMLTMFGLLAFWLARNIPAYPFTFLAPHEIAP